MIDLPIPEFINESADTIHKRMLEEAPSNINIIEGDMFWDCTRPSAEEKSRSEKIAMQNILRMAFTQSSTGKYLEYLGECKGIFKNLPTKSTGNVKVIGNPNTLISKDKIFCTEATEEQESIEFRVMETTQINEIGEVIVKVECLTTGTIGNVKANTIKIVATSINGVKEITNEEDFKGGTNIEDEEHFRERVMNAEQEESLSGADSDYIRWAKEVDGVGYAYVIEEWNGPGTVKILILDKNGQAATEELISKVKEYIYPDKKEGENRGGKAPLGAIVTISTPTTLEININANFIITSGFDKQLIFKSLEKEIGEYLGTIKINGIVNYNAILSIIGAYILKNEGIEDFNNLTINNSTSNIKLNDQVAVIGEVINSAEI